LSRATHSALRGAGGRFFAFEEAAREAPATLRTWSPRSGAISIKSRITMGMWTAGRHGHISTEKWLRSKT